MEFAGLSAMVIPEEVFEQSADELSAVIASVLDDQDPAQPASLARVHKAVQAEVKTITVSLN